MKKMMQHQEIALARNPKGASNMPPSRRSLTAPAASPSARSLTAREPERALDKRVPPRIRRAIELMVFDGLKRPEAATQVGIQDQTLRKHFLNQPVLREFNRQVQVLRDGERARNVHTGIAIRDTSQSDKAKIDAMKFIEGHHEKGGININVGVGVQVQPGYIVDISQHSAKAAHILQVSGSSRNTQQDQ